MIHAFCEFNIFHDKKAEIIDDAIALMKRYSDDNSHKYVNAILNRILS
jgi:transcription termination factor NusB